jgi:uncharacterized protein (DUF1499 family)
MTEREPANLFPRKRRMPLLFVWIGGVIGVLVLAGFLSIVIRNALSTRPADLGRVDGRLRPCPASPNCVCSQDTDPEHACEPLKYSGTPAEAMEKLKSVIHQMPRAEIVTDEPDYLHVEFTTAVMRYVDDVEFTVDPAGKVIQFRSASRLGYSDLGANRKRTEAIRAAFDAE